MKFYVTTPIYYVNDQPHIGHAYTTVAADVLARYHRAMGHKVFFLTGTDEHGQKVERAASAKGLTPKSHADLMVENFRSLWAGLGISNDAFIRTTDAGHREVVRGLLTELWEKGEIEKRSYKGWYCTPDERFWTAKDLVEGRCPDCGREVEEIEEENYFFLMSRYHERLVRHIEEDPGYILPETRRNEVMGFLKSQPLGDLCISRPKKRLSWGIPLPFDEEYVTYVWFDALINYYSATKYKAPPSEEEWWPADVHIVGKDILTTHAVYWSTMLMALGLPLPRRIFAHGWWTIEGRKMSKSLGNVVAPPAVIDGLPGDFRNDAFRYFLLREVGFGNDGDYSQEALFKRINVDLANDLGNLASRVRKMAALYFGGIVPEPEETEAEAKALAEGVPAAVEVALDRLQFNIALEEIWELVSFANKYIDSNAPWALAKNPAKRGRLGTVIYTSLEALRLIAANLRPFMPDSTELAITNLGGEMTLNWGGLKPGTKLGALTTMFPRTEASLPLPFIDIKATISDSPNKKEAKMENMDNLISIEDFAKVELKTGKVLTAERVPKSEKLLRLEIDTGEARQVVAGIGKAYAPEDLVGKTVVVVTNLKPAKLMGVESHGMLLAATAEGGQPVVLTTAAEVPPGVRVK